MDKTVPCARQWYLTAAHTWKLSKSGRESNGFYANQHFHPVNIRALRKLSLEESWSCQQQVYLPAWSLKSLNRTKNLEGWDSRTGQYLLHQWELQESQGTWFSGARSRCAEAEHHISSQKQVLSTSCRQPQWTCPFPFTSQSPAANQSIPRGLYKEHQTTLASCLSRDNPLTVDWLRSTPLRLDTAGACCQLQCLVMIGFQNSLAVSAGRESSLISVFHKELYSSAGNNRWHYFCSTIAAICWWGMNVDVLSVRKSRMGYVLWYRSYLAHKRTTTTRPYQGAVETIC